MSELTPDFRDDKPTNVRWGVFGVASGTSLLLYLHRYTFALIKPELKNEWGIGTDELGLLDSTFSFCYSVFQLPLGMAADGLGVHFVLTALILLWTGGLALHALAPSVKVLAVARGLLGAGQSAAFACLSRISKTWFPSAIRTSLQGFMGVFCGRMGGFFTNILFGTLLVGILGWTWRGALWLFVGLGLLQALVFAIVFRNSPRNHPWTNQAEAELIEGPGSERNAPRLTVRELFRRMTPLSIGNLLMLNLQTVLSTAADNIYSNWVPLFLAEEHGMVYREMGIYASLPLLGGACGGLLGGGLNDWLIRRLGTRRWARSLAGCGGKGGAALLLLGGLMIFDHPYLFCGLLFFVKLFSDVSLATTWGTVTDIGGRTSATVFAFNNAVAGIGSILAPALYGWIAQHYGWRPVFVTGAVFYLACAASWLMVKCTVPVIAEPASELRD